uniref:Putative transglutaminase domain-containing protein n=1 Tax=viral metagenome TaxID=1070528 RepID=A0A6H1ZPT3_9ZZZZ
MTCFIADKDEMVSELARGLNYNPEAMYYWVRDKIAYLPEQRVDLWFTPRTTILNRMGDCDDTSILLSSLLWNAGYRNRMVMSYIPKRDTGHIYVELRDTNGQWLKLDATCKNCKFGEFPDIEEQVIGYIYKDKTVVVNPRLYSVFIGDRFNWKFTLNCEKVVSVCKPYCSVFEDCKKCEDKRVR